MKVYIVTVMEPFSGHSTIVGVYSDKAKAEAEAASYTAVVGAVTDRGSEPMEIKTGGFGEWEVEE